MHCSHCQGGAGAAAIPAPDSLTKSLKKICHATRGEDYYPAQAETPMWHSGARQATQMAEDARVLTLRRKEQEKLDAETARSPKRSCKAKEEADAKAAQDQAAQSQAQAAQAQAQAEEDARRRAAAEQAPEAQGPAGPSGVAAVSQQPRRRQQRRRPSRQQRRQISKSRKQFAKKRKCVRVWLAPA